MAIMTWGETNLPLPDPEGIEVEDRAIAAGRRMASGVLRADYTAVKARITVHWPMLTWAERGVLSTRYNAGDAQGLVLPDGQTFTSVIAILDSWREQQWYDPSATAHYDVTITFEEV